MRGLLTSLVVVALCSCSSKGSSDRVAEQLAALQKKKEQEAKEKAKRDAERTAPAPVEAVKLDPPYDDTQATAILPDGPCPEGFWALFPTGEVPGATPEEKRTNAAKRKELAEQVRARKYLVKLRGPPQVVLSPYDQAAGKFTVDVLGTVDCTDALGRIALAWTDAKAGDPGHSAAKAEAEFAQNVWLAPPLQFELPLKSISEAKEFGEKNKFSLFARVAFTPGKTELDKKVRKVARVQEKAHGETLAFGGGSEDWGAGRLLRAEVLGVRLANDREKHQLAEKTSPR